MQISEIYASKQGEGRLTGEPSIFVRTSGCNLRCDFCDTPYTSWSPEGSRRTMSEVLAEISRFRERHVVLTGGEPLLSKELVALTEKLSANGYHITIETAGTIYRPVKCDLMSISPKLSNSTPSLERAGEWSKRHEKNRINLDVLNRLIREYDYQLKFVVASEPDCLELRELCDQLETVVSEKILLMPEGVVGDVLDSREKWITEMCDRYGYSYCPRMHIKWYGNQRGT
ncbi:MAG: 7-carboxy-7-deazaguanine synthase QueE [Planctomycetota bacterium]